MFWKKYINRSNSKSVFRFCHQLKSLSTNVHICMDLYGKPSQEDEYKRYFWLTDMRFRKFSRRFHRRAWKYSYKEWCRGSGRWQGGDRERSAHEEGKDHHEPFWCACHGTCYKHSDGRCWGTFYRLFHTLASTRACKRFGREPQCSQTHLLQDPHPSQSHLQRDWLRFLRNNCNII